MAVAEAAVILLLFLVWQVSAGRRRSLQRRVRSLEQGRRRRRSILSPEGAVRAVWDTATLVRDKGVGGAFRSSISEIANWAQVERPDLVRLAGVDGCVAIMFSDIAERQARRQGVRSPARATQCAGQQTGRPPARARDQDPG